MNLCGKYLGDNDATCPQLTCIREKNHDGLCDNVNGDNEVLVDDESDLKALRRIAARGFDSVTRSAAGWALARIVAQDARIEDFEKVIDSRDEAVACADKLRNDAEAELARIVRKVLTASECGQTKPSPSPIPEAPSSRPGSGTIAGHLTRALSSIGDADEELEVELFTAKADPNGPLTPDERGRIALWNAVQDIESAQKIDEQQRSTTTRRHELDVLESDITALVLEIARHAVAAENTYRRECYPGLGGSRRQELQASRSYWIDQLGTALARLPLTYADGFRRCEFCGCNTNAKQRLCCPRGQAADNRVVPIPAAFPVGAIRELSNGKLGIVERGAEGLYVRWGTCAGCPPAAAAYPGKTAPWMCENYERDDHKLRAPCEEKTT